MVIRMAVISLPVMEQPGDLNSRVASEVRALKGRYAMTQHQVAEILGISQSQVAKRLNGKIPFTLDDIQRLADFFGIDPAELLGGTRVGPRPDGGPTGGLAQRRSTLPKS